MKSILFFTALLTGCATLKQEPPLPVAPARSFTAASSVAIEQRKPLVITWDPQTDAEGYRVNLGAVTLDVKNPPVDITDPMYGQANGIYRLTVQATNSAGLFSDHSKPLYLYWLAHPQN